MLQTCISKLQLCGTDTIANQIVFHKAIGPLGVGSTKRAASFNIGDSPMPPAGSKVEPKGVSSWFTPQIVPIFTAAIVGVVSALFVVGSTWEGLNRDIASNTALAQKAITQASATRGHVTLKTNELAKPLNELGESVAVMTDALRRIESGQAEVNERLEREILLLRNGGR